MTNVVSQEFFCEICNNCKLCELRKSYKKELKGNATTCNRSKDRDTHVSTCISCYKPSVQKKNNITRQSIPRCKNSRMQRLKSRHSCFLRPPIVSVDKMKLINASCRPSKHSISRRLEQEIQLKKSKMNQKIENAKKICLIKSQRDGLRIKSLESAIKENQDKFLKEKFNKYDSLQSTCTDSSRKTMKEDILIRNYFDQNKADKRYHCRQSVETKLNEINTNNATPMKLEFNKVKMSKSPSKKKFSGERYSNNFFRSHSPETNKRIITKMATNNEKHIRPKTTEAGKKDACTYIAPIEHVQQKLKNVSYTIGHSIERLGNLNNTIYHKDSGKKAKKSFEKKTGKNVKPHDNKGAIADRIEKYKEEYCNMNLSIHENIKVINNHAEKLQNVRCSNRVKNKNEITKKTVGDIDDSNNVNGDTIHEEKVETNNNFEYVKKGDNLKRNNGDLKSEVIYEEKKKDYQVLITERELHETIHNSKETFFEKTQRLARMFRESQKKIKASDVAKRRNTINTEIPVHTEIDVLPTCCGLTGAGDITQIDSSLDDLETFIIENKINSNIRNSTSHQEGTEIEKNTNVKKEEEINDYVLVSLVENKENFKYLQSQRPKQDCSSIKNKIPTIPRKPSDCIKLKGIRKKNHLALKNSESDGEIFRQRQTKVNRQGQEKLNRKDLFTKALNKESSAGKILNTENTYDNNMDQHNKEFEGDELQKCTEYFIQLLKSFRPDLIHYMKRTLTAENKASHEIVYNLKHKSNSVEMYKENINARKQETHKIMEYIDEKLNKLNLSFSTKFVQDKKKESSAEKTEKLSKTIPRKTNKGSIMKQNVRKELNLDDVFANENNWIKLDLLDEQRIKKDICELINQNNIWNI